MRNAALVGVTYAGNPRERVSGENVASEKSRRRALFRKNLMMTMLLLPMMVVAGVVELSVMFKCDDETIFSLSSVVCTCKDGKGFRVEIATHGNVITSKLIFNDDHERMLDRMNDLGYFQGSCMSKSIIPVRRIVWPNEV